VTDLPDFHIPHAEKIAWMIDTGGYAVEPVPARVDTDPPQPGYLYSIGLPEEFGFPEVIVFGLTPAEAGGLVALVADLLRGGTEIPVGVELAGIFDGELRARLAPLEPDQVQAWLPSSVTWRGAPSDAVQLLWPDRNGFLPYEAGFEQRLRRAQPVIGRLG
jgi:hypothetical protein